MEGLKKMAEDFAAEQAKSKVKQEVHGWWESFQQEVKDGKFNTYARVGGSVIISFKGTLELVCHAQRNCAFFDRVLYLAASSTLH